MSDADFRPEARAPRGFADKRAADLYAERRILEAVSRVYERYGFEPLDTGAFEYADALGKFLPDSDRPNEGVFALQDDDEQWLALRYALTAPLARFAAENWETLSKPFRRYAFGPVWRNAKPGPGRYRQIIQCDADTVGSSRPEADAEMIAMGAEGFEAAGLERGDYLLKISNRKLLTGLLATAGVASAGRDEGLDRLGGGSAEGDAGLEELARIDAALTAMGVGPDRALFDPAVVRGLEYYTGTVFEAELQLQTTDDRGEPVRFGSVGGGGRYDDLVARFTGQVTPATGFSFGVSRLAAALSAAGRGLGEKARGPVVVIAFDQAQMADYFAVAGELRTAGIPAEVYLGGSGMKAQMKYADRRLSPAAVIIGGDELAAGTVTIKDLDLGRELSSQVTDNAAWRAERPGQQTIPRAEMVAAIRRIIG